MIQAKNQFLGGQGLKTWTYLLLNHEKKESDEISHLTAESVSNVSCYFFQEKFLKNNNRIKNLL